MNTVNKNGSMIIFTLDDGWWCLMNVRSFIIELNKTLLGSPLPHARRTKTKNISNRIKLFEAEWRHLDSNKNS